MMKILKMANIKRNACLSGAAPTNPRLLGQKLGCKSPRVGANFWCISTGVRGRGMVMDEIDTCMIKVRNNIKKNWLYVD